MAADILAIVGLISIWCFIGVVVATYTDAVLGDDITIYWPRIILFWPGALCCLLVLGLLAIWHRVTN